jgi:hypothetical protein
MELPVPIVLKKQNYSILFFNVYQLSFLIQHEQRAEKEIGS